MAEVEQRAVAGPVAQEALVARKEVFHPEACLPAGSPAVPLKADSLAVAQKAADSREEEPMVAAPLVGAYPLPQKGQRDLLSCILLNQSLRCIHSCSSVPSFVKLAVHISIIITFN